MPKGISCGEVDITWDSMWRKLLIPPMDNYMFKGWTTIRDDADSLVYAEDTTLDKDMTIYALWEKASKVIYDANGGYFDDDPNEVTYVQDIEKDYRLNDYKNDMPDVDIDDDLVLGGWSLTKDGKNKVNMNSKVREGATVTLYAIWVPAKTITLNGNGGGHGWVVTWEYKAPIGMPADPVRHYGDPEREGYFFDGWNIVRTADAGNPDAEILNDKPLSTSELLFDYVVNEDITAYAAWADSVTITLDAGDKGHFEKWDYDDDDDGILTETKTYQINMKKGEDLSYVLDHNYIEPVSDDGQYKIVGWSDTPGGKSIDLSEIQADKDMTIYAVWSPVVKVKLHYNAQTLTDAARKLVEGIYGTDSIVISIPVGSYWNMIGYNWIYTSPYPIIAPNGRYNEEDYNFIGWSTTPDGESLIDNIYIEQDMELYAVWKPAIMVTYHANGGCFNSNSSYVELTGRYLKDQGIAEPVPYQSYPYARASRDDYALAGWSTVSGNDNSLVDADTYKMGMSPDLYAVWTKDYYTLSLDMGEYVCEDMSRIQDDENDEAGDNDSPLYIDSDDYDEDDDYRETKYVFAPMEWQIKSHRLPKGSSIGDLIYKQYMLYGTFYTCKDTNFEDRLYLKGFSTQKSGAPLIDTNSYKLTKDTKLYAVYEDSSSLSQRENIEKDEVLSQISAEGSETEAKAQKLVSMATDKSTPKKTLSDVIVPGESSVLVNAITEIKDQSVIDSFKNVLVSYMDIARENKSTVETVQLLDMSASGSGKVMIYVGKAYNGRMAIVGHYKNGVWENQQCVVDWNGYICPSFNSFSPISISILSDGNALNGLADTWKEETRNDQGEVPGKQSQNANEQGQNSNKQNQDPNDRSSNSVKSANEENKLLMTDIAGLSISISKDSFTYTGKVQKPSVTVKETSGKTLIAGTDYDVTYSDGSIKVGEYMATVKCKGSYTGTRSVTYSIVPKNASKLKAKASGAAIKVTWKKQTKETDGYEVQYSEKKDYKKAKTQTVKKNKTTSVVLKKKIKKGKTYYVRIRSFKTIGGKKIYSEWSGNKKVKIK